MAFFVSQLNPVSIWNHVICRHNWELTMLNSQEFAAVLRSTCDGVSSVSHSVLLFYGQNSYSFSVWRNCNSYRSEEYFYSCWINFSPLRLVFTSDRVRVVVGVKRTLMTWWKSKIRVVSLSGVISLTESDLEESQHFHLFRFSLRLHPLGYSEN